MSDEHIFIGGRWTIGAGPVLAVEEKFSGEQMAELRTSSPEEVAMAVGFLNQAEKQRVLTSYERASMLASAASLVEGRSHEIRDILVREAGFPVGDADGEIARTVETLRLSSEEATRLSGEVVPIDGAPGQQERIAFTVRRPIGIVCAITPFNSPLNTVAHKIAPALAAGNAVVLKPSAYTPTSASWLVRILLESGFPPTYIALVQGRGNSVGSALLNDNRVGFYTFTGSTDVGRLIAGTVGLRRTQLELGSLSCTIVCADADVDTAVKKSAKAAFRKAGQVCTSVQRLYVHRDVYSRVVASVSEEAMSMPTGDPTLPETVVGPMVSLGEAKRVMGWVERAAKNGARIHAGGTRSERVIAPTVLTGADPTAEVMCREVFGPVVNVIPFTKLSETIDQINATPYGLASGIFTYDVRLAMQAALELRMGAVHINETSSSRADLMPYGGVKESGNGREGPRYAAREMTEERLITIRYA